MSELSKSDQTKNNVNITFFNVDKLFEDTKDLTALLDKCHKAGMFTFEESGKAYNTLYQFTLSFRTLALLQNVVLQNSTQNSQTGQTPQLSTLKTLDPKKD
jgi:hypothetical protein